MAPQVVQYPRATSLTAHSSRAVGVEVAAWATSLIAAPVGETFFVQHEAYLALCETKFAQRSPSRGIVAKKLAQHAIKRRLWAFLSTQGELFRARTHISPRRVNFFAHRTQPRADCETNDTSAATDAGQHETAVTAATEKCAKNTHFSPAKAMAVSTDPPSPARKGDAGFNPTHIQASKGDTGFTREISDAGGRRQGQSQTKVARNLTRSVLKNASKRCNSNDVNSTFEILEGELRAKLGTVSARRQVRSGRDTCAVAAGPGRAIHSDTAPLVWRAPEGPEDARGHGCGASGRRQGPSQT